MDTKLLMQRVLDLAMQGKLVPQDTNDESASILLERIRTDKEKLFKEGRLKRDKKESVIYRRDNSYYELINGVERCIDEQIPFIVPNSWEWVRLKQVVFNHGQKKPESDFCYIDIGSINNKNHCLNETEMIISKDKAPSRARKIVKRNDIIYSTVRPYLHNMCIIDKNFSLEPIASTGFAVLACHVGVFNKYLFFYMLSSTFDSYASDTDNAKGLMYPAINDERLYNALIPIPPLEEQKRIVALIASVQQKISLIENDERLIKELSSLTKSKVLDLAIRGQLVLQDPKDKPASLLIDNIRIEKEKLIQEGKLRRDKKESVTYRRSNSYYEILNGVESCIDKEIPFKIPASWEWVRASEVLYVEMGQSPNGNSVSNSAEGIEFHQGKVFFGKKYLSKSNQTTREPKKIAPAGSVLICVRAPVGKVNITQREICIGRGLCSIRPIANILIDFLYYLFITYEDVFTQKASGTTFDAITGDLIKEQLIPLPPLEEQKRIIKKIEKIFTFIDIITNV